jgi:hypothetical protein
MKSKKVFRKKLVLTKKTVADLNNTDLRKVHGGGRITVVITRCITNCIMCPSMKCA